MSSRFSLLLALLLVVAGCAVGPNYQGPPGNAAPARFVRGDVADGPPLSRWWTALGDPTLDALVARALSGNPNLQVSTARLLRARGELRGQEANGAPSLNASATYARARLPPISLTGQGGGDPIRLTLYNVGFDASWEIDLFGGQRRAVEAATASLGAAEANIEDAQVSLVADVAQAYVNLRDTQGRLVLARAAIERQERMLQLTQARQAGGTASRLDVSRLQTQLESTRADALPLAAQADAYRDALAVLVGVAPGTLDEELAAGRPVPLPPAQVAVGDPAALLQRRPDIRAAERRLAARTAQIGQAEAARFPKLSFLGLIGLGGSKLSDLFEIDNRTELFAPRLTWSFLDFGRNAARVQEANADREEAEAQYRTTVLAALRDAEDALARFRDRRHVVATLARAREAADESTRMMRARQQGGTASVIDLLDVERQQIAAEQNLSQATAALTNDFVSLHKALGLGWSAPGAGNP